MKIPVLLDTDIGSDIDDALALAYLLSQPRCDLLGITTVSGEAPLRAEMASAICHHVGRADIPVHSGTEQALLGDILQKTAPQAAVLGLRPRRRGVAPNTAIDFLRSTIRARPHEVTLLAIGPMTNIGLLFALDPEIPSLLRSLVLMCGQFRDAMRGEWNAINDPHATAIAYGNGMQTKPSHHVSFGLDVTMQCKMPVKECRARFTAKVLEPVRDFAEVWFKGCPEVTWHDPLAAASIFEPTLCTYRTGHVHVSLHAPTLGWTVFDDSRQQLPPPHTIADTVDAKRFLDHYFSVVRE